MDTMTTNENIYNINQIRHLSQSDFSDLYCRENGVCSFQLPKFPSKEHKEKNFKYILSEMSQKLRKNPRSEHLSQQYVYN